MLFCCFYRAFFITLHQIKILEHPMCAGTGKFLKEKKSSVQVCVQFACVVFGSEADTELGGARCSSRGANCSMVSNACRLFNCRSSRWSPPSPL